MGAPVKGPKIIQGGMGVAVSGWQLARAVALTGQMQWSAVQVGLAWPVFTMPEFSVPALVSLALPLFVVTMAGFLPRHLMHVFGGE